MLLLSSPEVIPSFSRCIWFFGVSVTTNMIMKTQAPRLQHWVVSLTQSSCSAVSFMASFMKEKKYFFILFQVNRRNVICAMLVFAFVGSSLINFSNEINSFVTYSALSILGVGMSGLLTASLYLVNEFSTK